MLADKERDLINYSKCALLVWDMQYGLTSRTMALDSIVENIRRLVDTCHKCIRPVFFTQSTGLPYAYQSPYNRFWLKKRGIDPKVPRLVEGSHDWDIRRELSPSEGDFVMKKTTHSVFVGTNFEQIARNAGIETIVMSGVSAEVGVESTARHAASLGFIPVIAEDAVGSSDKDSREASLSVMRKLFRVDTAEEISNRIASECKSAAGVG